MHQHTGLQLVCGRDCYGVRADCDRVDRLITLLIPAISPALFLKGEMAPAKNLKTIQRKVYLRKEIFSSKYLFNQCNHHAIAVDL